MKALNSGLLSGSSITGRREAAYYRFVTGSFGAVNRDFLCYACITITYYRLPHEQRHDRLIFIFFLNIVVHIRNLGLINVTYRQRLRSAYVTVQGVVKMIYTFKM